MLAKIMSSLLRKSKKPQLKKAFLNALFSGVFFLLLLPTDAFATLKVQQGTTTITAGNTSVVVNITAVNDINRAFLLMSFSGDSGTDRIKS